jgi:hypothetical protein
LSPVMDHELWFSITNYFCAVFYVSDRSVAGHKESSL